MYSARLARRDRSRLYRIRWYGERPSLFFMECKEHNDKWTGVQVKEQKAEAQYKY